MAYMSEEGYTLTNGDEIPFFRWEHLRACLHTAAG